MKTTGIFLTGIFFFIIILDLSVEVLGNYQYSKQYESYWNLSVKAYSIPKKIEGLDNFISALEGSDLSGKYNAVFMNTPDNSFDQNFEALKSLQIRLHEISKMDVTSFQYQAALAQITQQEQNEPKEMLNVFEGIWWKENHFLIWGWIGAINVIVSIILLILGVAMWNENNY